MRWLLCLFLMLGAVVTTQAATFVYVSLAPEQKLNVYRLDPSDGKLTLVEAVAVDGAPGALTTDFQQKYLFASLRSKSSLASFTLDGATGKLQPINTVALDKGANAAYVSTDRTGQWLLSASYMGGQVVVHGLEGGKILTPATEKIKTVMTAHCVALAPGDRYVFVPHVAPNAVYQYKFDVVTGKLTDIGQAPGGADKAGPRHLAVHPKEKLAFTSDETGNSITAYRFESGKGLKPVQTVSTLPDDFKGKNSTAEVRVHPSGKFVWVSNRGHDSLAGFAIGEDGKLKALGQTPTEKTPRSFVIEPAGKYLLSAGEGSGKLAVFQIDADTGALKRLHTVEVGKSLTWVHAVEVK